ncbi:MAG: hypothetical protein Q9191_006272 [Dirinaria sp. TL-2023a]
MDHSSVLPDGPSELLWQKTPVTSVSTNLLPTPHQYDRLNQQTRRLQLRNAGFRGTFLPTRRISPIFRSASCSEPSSGPSNENRPLSPDRRTLYGEDMPPSPVNILQEIHNSTRRRKKTIRPGLGSIFQDQTATESTTSLGGRSWYNDSSNTCSPVTSNTLPANMMKLREGSLNQKSPPPLSSPLAKQSKSRNPSRLNLRSTSFEASKYIEHLESQLTALNTKLDSLVSPNTNKARAAKLRALTTEVRSLRHELADWEKNFADRVRDGVEQGLGLEMGLRSRLLAAEDDTQIKEMRIKELEFEVETLRLRVKDTESLEITNANLEKRIDVLTSLLVQSPTKLEFGSASSSPGKTDPQKRTPRPRSMLPRIPSSPGRGRLSLSTIGEAAFWNPRALRSDSISESPARPHDDGLEDPIKSPEPATDLSQDGIFETDSGTSNSYRSVPSSSSRPTSFYSSSSFAAPSWGLPLGSEADIRSKPASRPRRMRRFPSGSGTLKPLILPSAATTQSLPASGLANQDVDAGKRDISNFSLDPTTAFLSEQDPSSPTCTPTQTHRRQSVTSAQEQALKLLEGKGDRPRRPTKDEAVFSPASTLGEHLTGTNVTPESLDGKKTRPKSLEEELKQAFLDTSDSSFAASFQDGLIPVVDSPIPSKPFERESGTAGSSVDSVPMLVDVDERPEPSTSAALNVHQRKINNSEKSTPKPSKPLNLTRSPTRSPPSSAMATHNVPGGLCTRLTNMIASTRQDPIALAQRLLYNAWSLGAARLGGICWWLLGVLSVSRSRKKRKTDDMIGESQQTLGSLFNWGPYSAEASRRRTGQCFVRDQRGRESRSRKEVAEDADCQVTREPHVFPCEYCEEPSSRRTFRLWFQFSLMIVLAVGVAIKHGPGTLLEPPPRSPTISPTIKQRRESIDATCSPRAIRKEHHQNGSTRSRLPDPEVGPKPVTFASILSPADFEGRAPAAITGHHMPS